MIPKWYQNDSNMISKWWKHDANMMPKWCPNDAKMMQKWFQKDAKVIPKWCQNDAKNVPKMIDFFFKDDVKLHKKTSTSIQTLYKVIQRSYLFILEIYFLIKNSYLSFKISWGTSSSPPIISTTIKHLRIIKITYLSGGKLTFFSMYEQIDIPDPFGYSKPVHSTCSFIAHRRWACGQ